MHPSLHARSRPDHPAIIVADTGDILTYAKLDEASNRTAHLLRSWGLRPGDRIAAIIGNWLAFPVVYWGAQRAGIMITLISRHLKPEEAAYIVNDSDAKALFIVPADSETAQVLVRDRATLIPGVARIVTGPDPIEGTLEMVAAMVPMPTTPVADEISGFHLIYSSGTTGRPKGVAMPFEPGPIDRPHPSEGSTRLYEGLEPLVSFNAGPLYHGAPLNCMLLTHRLGGTFVTLSKWDAQACLKAVETCQVNHAQFVPTMFVRLLALPEEVRRGFDLSSLKFVLHAAAPCPVGIKRAMIDWLGPIVHEYYASTEGVGSTYITSEEWLRKPGSVGRSALGPIHICDGEGRELPAGGEGVIWFEAPPGRRISYRNDPDKTRKATHPVHPNWFTVGDIGRLDEDGYLFLTDRKDFMIISGGVNIYPQAVEDCLIVHPRVLDAAVIGVPDPEYGEAVLAIVQPVGSREGLEADLRAWCAERISPVTAPRRYRFVDELPRLPSGKLAKHELKQRFAATQGDTGDD